MAYHTDKLGGLGEGNIIILFGWISNSQLTSHKYFSHIILCCFDICHSLTLYHFSEFESEFEYEERNAVSI